MSIIDYFKLQAKNLMRDWETHQEDGELGYVYSPRYFDIGGLLDYFEEDETKFCLQRAQHLIAKLVGFRKWDNLIHARDEKQRFAKTVFSGLIASNDLITAYDEWQDYCYSNGIDELDIKNQIYLAQRFFRLPVDEEFKKENPVQEHLDQWYKSLKPYIERAVLINESIRPYFEQLKEITNSSVKISEQIRATIMNSLRPVESQIQKMNEIIKDYYEGIERIVHESTFRTESYLGEIRAISEKSLDHFNNSVTKLIPETIDGFAKIKQLIVPDPEVFSSFREAYASIINHERKIRNELNIILERYPEARND